MLPSALLAKESGMIKACLLLLTLSGCSQLYDFTPQAIAAKKQYSDVEASAAMQGPCLMTLGAWIRLPPAKQETTEAYAREVCP